MSYRQIIKLHYYKLFVLAAFFFVLLPINRLNAQEDKSAIVLYTSNVEFSYHQPFRNSYKSNHPSYIEVPRLNHYINLIQNYIQFLKKLDRLKGNPNIRVSYAPDAVMDSDEPQTRIIKINDLGLASLLQKVNKYLTEYGFVNLEDIIDTPEGLYNLPEQDITKPSNFSKSAYFKNVSLAIPSNEPDTSYVVLKDRVLTTRLSSKTNSIYSLSLNDKPEESGLFLNDAKIWYQNMRISYDETFLSLTDGLSPLILNLNTKELVELFPDNENISLLGGEWSPTQNLLAGIVLDEKTFERQAYIYDADKKQMIDVGGFSNTFESNYLYATPVWAPNGKKLVFISAKSVHLIDLEKNKCCANLVNVEGEIGEFIWSEDANSFAFVEVKGQTRNQYHFDDYDFRGCILHRYRFNESMVNVAEDYAQCVESRNTIKMISFTDKDQILYLEGKLVAPDVPGSFWDLSKTFNAYLTPLPTKELNSQIDKSKDKVKPQQLPLQFLYVYRSLDSKNANIYDSGKGHSNLLYTDDFYSNWFIGLYRQGGIDYKGQVYSFRSSPYPFQCYNYSYFLNKSQGHARLLLKFLQDYNIRSTESDENQIRVYMHANFSGILNVWCCTSDDLFNYLVNGDKVRETPKKEVTVSEADEEQSTETNSEENDIASSETSEDADESKE